MNNMNIKLEKVRLEDRNKLERLLQLYLHDLSLYFPITFNSDICQYEYDLDKYFIDNYAYFIKSDKDILGFVLIDDNGNNNYEISEMFVYCPPLVLTVSNSSLKHNASSVLLIRVILSSVSELSFNNDGISVIDFIVPSLLYMP